MTENKSNKNPGSGQSILHLNGIFPPIPTSFDAKGHPAFEEIQRNIVALSQFDLRGFVVLGSNGEYVMLSTQEKLLVLQASRAAIPPDKLMIAGTGCQSTSDTVNLTQKAAQIGADIALVITPSYYLKQMTPAVLINHFSMVAEMSPIPVMLYNMPACTGIDMDEDTIAALAEQPNIIGIKDSSGNMVKLASLRQKVGPGFQILAGSAGFLLPAITMGASGGVLALANIAPEQCIAIQRFHLEGRRQEARDLQIRMVPVNTAVTSKWGVAGLKAAMDLLGFYGGPVRLPLMPLSDEDNKQLQSILIAGGLL